MAKKKIKAKPEYYDRYGIPINPPRRARCSAKNKPKQRPQKEKVSMAVKLRNKAILHFDPNLRKLPYREFLKTPYWRSVAALKRIMDGQKCRQCGSTWKLQVHHLTYAFLGSDHLHMETLKTLCERCHKMAHNLA